MPRRTQKNAGDAGSHGWRLLGAAWLIFVAPLLCGQDDLANRHTAKDHTVQPTSPPNPLPWRLPAAAAEIIPHGIPRSQGIDSGAALERLVRAAGIIFCGRVTDIGHPVTLGGQNSGSTTITFQVEQAIRGAFPGRRLTIHEWSGLWNRGERYRVGERVVLFLYPRSRLGFTSPVSGGMGRFDVDAADRVVMNAQQIAAFAADRVFGAGAEISSSVLLGAARRFASEEPKRTEQEITRDTPD